MTTLIINDYQGDYTTEDTVIIFGKKDTQEFFKIDFEINQYKDKEMYGLIVKKGYLNKDLTEDMVNEGYSEFKAGYCTGFTDEEYLSYTSFIELLKDYDLTIKDLNVNLAYSVLCYIDDYFESVNLYEKEMSEANVFLEKIKRANKKEGSAFSVLIPDPEVRKLIIEIVEDKINTNTIDVYIGNDKTNYPKIDKMLEEIENNVLGKQIDNNLHKIFTQDKSQVIKKI